MKHLFLLVILAFLISCQSKEGMAPESRKVSQANLESEASMMPENDANPSQSNIAIERKLIKNGQLSFEVSNIIETKKLIDKTNSDFNAYPSSESQSNFDDRIQYNLVVRIPASRFDEYIEKMVKLASKVENKNITTEDVTEQFIDTEARIKTKKELEVRYREILKQAKTVEDMLSIETQLNNMRTEIEAAEGKLNYLKSQISMSTLTITYYQLIGTDFGFGYKFSHSIRQGWDNLLMFLIGLTSISHLY